MPLTDKEKKIIHCSICMQIDKSSKWIPDGWEMCKCEQKDTHILSDKEKQEIRELFFEKFRGSLILDEIIVYFLSIIEEKVKEKEDEFKIILNSGRKMYQLGKKDALESVDRSVRCLETVDGSLADFFKTLVLYTINKHKGE